MLCCYTDKLIGDREGPNHQIYFKWGSGVLIKYHHDQTVWNLENDKRARKGVISLKQSHQLS